MDRRNLIEPGEILVWIVATLCILMVLSCSTEKKLVSNERTHEHRIEERADSMSHVARTDTYQKTAEQEKQLTEHTRSTGVHQREKDSVVIYIRPDGTQSQEMWRWRERDSIVHDTITEIRWKDHVDTTVVTASDTTRLVEQMVKIDSLNHVIEAQAVTIKEDALQKMWAVMSCSTSLIMLVIGIYLFIRKYLAR